MFTFDFIFSPCSKFSSHDRIISEDSSGRITPLSDVTQDGLSVVIELMLTSSVPTFFSLTTTLPVVAVKSSQNKPEPKEIKHLSCKKFSDFNTPEYVIVPIAIITINMTQPYVIKNSIELCAFFILYIVNMGKFKNIYIIINSYIIIIVEELT